MAASSFSDAELQSSVDEHRIVSETSTSKGSVQCPSSEPLPGLIGIGTKQESWAAGGRDVDFAIQQSVGRASVG